MLKLNRSNLAWQQLDEIVYLLTVRDNRMHELNGVGSQIFLWLWNEEDIDNSALVQKLSDTFDVTTERATADLDRFIAELQSKDILTRE